MGELNNRVAVRLAGMLAAVLLLAGMPVHANDTRAYTLVGSLTQGALMIGKTLPGSQVKQDNEMVRVSAQGEFLLGFGRDEAEQSLLMIVLPDGRQVGETLQIGRRKYDIQRIDGLPSRKVTPTSPQDLQRIREDAAAARKARARDDARTDFATGFIWPVIGPISGVYGSQRILNGEARRPHFGVDIARPVGTPVHAPADGLVTLAHPDMFYSGGTLIIDHGHKLTSTFLHLSKLHVHEGMQVRQGDLIAEVGATGRVTGAHLDWRMNLRDKRIDPQLLAGPMPPLAQPDR